MKSTECSNAHRTSALHSSTLNWIAGYDYWKKLNISHKTLQERRLLAALNISDLPSSALGFCHTDFPNRWNSFEEQHVPSDIHLNQTSHNQQLTKTEWQPLRLRV